MNTVIISTLVIALVGLILGGALVTVGGLYLLTRKKRRRRDA